MIALMIGLALTCTEQCYTLNPELKGGLRGVIRNEKCIERCNANQPNAAEELHQLDRQTELEEHQLEEQEQIKELLRKEMKELEQEENRP